jgi:hypothetical protein
MLPESISACRKRAGEPHPAFRGEVHGQLLGTNQCGGDVDFGRNAASDLTEESAAPASAHPSVDQARAGDHVRPDRHLPKMLNPFPQWDVTHSADDSFRQPALAWRRGSSEAGFFLN